MKSRQFDLIVFDWDGTLFDSTSLIVQCIQAACRDLGISPVAVFSDADRGSLHVRLADEAVHIGPAPAPDSYLLPERILAAAARTADCETPTKAQIREALSDSARLAEWHHIERSGRIKREFFTTASAAVEAVKIKRRQGDLVAQMIEEQRRLGAIK